MARIRSLKPDAFESQTLAKVSVEAERTFLGLSTQVDDRGRIADKPATLNGNLWAERAEYKSHTPRDLETELAELAAAGLVCRYTGCDDKRYLHLVSWDEHQKIDRPSKSRAPRCPEHGGADYCGRHEGDCPDRPTPEPIEPSRGSREGSRALDSQETGHDDAVPAGDVGATPGSGPAASATSVEEIAGGSDLGESRSSRDPREGSMLDLGPRTVDRGSIPPSAGAPAPRADGAVTEVAEEALPKPVTAQTIVGEWIERCAKRPPGNVIGQISKHVKTMLAEGVDAYDIRRGLNDWMGRDLHPSTLPSLVNSAMNARPGSGRASPPGRGRPQSTTDQRVADALELSRQLAAEVEPQKGITS